MSKDTQHPLKKLSPNLEASTIPRRSKQKINRTEIAILGFMLGRIDTSDCDFGYSVCASNRKLQAFAQKSRSQIQRGLRHLEELGLMDSSHSKPFKGTPVLFSLTFPQYAAIKRLLGKAGANLLSHYIELHLHKKHNPISAAEMAIHFNVRKRTAQKAIKHLLSTEVVRPTHMWSYSRRRRRYVKIPGYELTEGQKPITHWIEESSEGKV